MIARMWHGETPAGKADDYVEYLQHTGLADFKATEGNRGFYLLRRIEGERAHFLILSLWDSVASIRQFAGEDIEKARYYAGDADFLLAFEPTVQHYEVLVES
jgi:heme-degrading monooxygenase HmoA